MGRGRPRTRPDPEKITPGDFIVLCEGPGLPEKHLARACALIRQRTGAWDGAGRPWNLNKLAQLVSYYLELMAAGKKAPRAEISAELYDHGRIIQILSGLGNEPKELAQITPPARLPNGSAIRWSEQYRQDARNTLNKSGVHRRYLSKAHEIAKEIMQW